MSSTKAPLHAAALALTEKWILFFALVLPSLATYEYFIVLSGQPLMQPVYAFSKTLQFGFPVVWVVLILRERHRIFGSGLAKVGEGVWFGLAVAAAAVLLYVFWLKDSQAFAAMPARLLEKVRGLGADSPLKFLMLGAFISIIHSLLEEYYWRWFVFGRLKKYLALAPAIAISSLGFMAHHVLVVGAYIGMDHWPVALFLSACVAAGGAWWAGLYYRSGNLIAPWISHLIVDCALVGIGYDQLWGWKT